MNERKNVKMQIRIAGEQITLNVGFDQQDDVREAERSVDDLYRKWRKQFPMRSDTELLAMISYQYAFYYHELGRRLKKADDMAADIAADIDRLLGDTG